MKVVNVMRIKPYFDEETLSLVNADLTSDKWLVTSSGMVNTDELLLFYTHMRHCDYSI
jgi:hypothetical protein